MKAKLIMIVLPVVIAVIAILLVLTYEKSKTIIVDYANNLVGSMTESNQHEIEIWSKDILSGLNQIQNTINTLNLDQAQYEAYLMSTAKKNDSYQMVYMSEWKTRNSLTHRAGNHQRITLLKIATGLKMV